MKLLLHIILLFVSNKLFIMFQFHNTHDIYFLFILLNIYMYILDTITSLQSLINYWLCQHSFTWCIYMATTTRYLQYLRVNYTADSLTINKSEIDNISDKLLLKFIRYYMLNNGWSNSPNIIVYDKFNNVIVHVITISDNNRFITSMPYDHYINYDKLKSNQIVINYLNNC
jgi:hypothetical protein